jgi:CheY-like chemotaxis protein
MDRPFALIIDDNRKNLQILATLLTRQGLDHADLPDPRLVEEILPTLERLNIVFLDLEMPGLNGYDVLEIFKADPRFHSVPVVAYTVHVSEITEAYTHGFHSFLAKPIDPDLFPEHLSRILGGERLWIRG